MIAGSFPGKRKLFDSTLLKKAIDSIGFPVQVQWNSDKPPRSIFSQPRDFKPTDYTTANQVSVFYNNVEIISAYSLAAKNSMGKILIRDKLLDEQQINQVRTALGSAGITLKASPSLTQGVLCSGLHFAFLLFIIFFGLITGEMILLVIGVIGLPTIIVGILLMAAEVHSVGLIIFMIGMIFTVPSGLLQMPLVMYIATNSVEKKPRLLHNASP